MGCFLTATKADLQKARKARQRAKRTPPPPPLPQNQTQAEAKLLALMTVSPLLALKVIKSIGGNYYNDRGDYGQQMAEVILHKEMNIEITARTRKHGPDLMGVTLGGYEVSVEVKTKEEDKSFNRLLDPPSKYKHKHRQCSDVWFKENAKISDTSTLRVLGVHINPEKNTVSIYRRVDSEASVWKCLVRNAPLSKYFNSGKFEKVNLS